MGNVVIIDHNNGIYSLYAHMKDDDSISVTDGDDVTKGDPIGIMGNTGSWSEENSTCPPFGVHLHFEVKSWPVLGSLDNDLGPNWGYTPNKPNWHGYINPSPYCEYSINDISPTPIRVTTNNAPVRIGPDPSYAQFATVSSGQKFVAISEYGGWYMVYIPSNNGPATGWIQGAVESSGIILKVNDNDPARRLEGVKVRAMPSTSSENRISYVWDGQLFLEKNHAPSASDDECRKQWYEIYLPDGPSSPTGWVCGEYLLTISSDVFVPDIKANGQDGSITVSPSTPVSINISVDSGDKAGQNADWWIAVKTPFAPPGDWYTYVHPTGWMPGVNFCAQAGLFDLAPFEVLNMPLPVGTYTFYFALDDPDGMATGPWWGLDSVEVTVEY